MTDPAYDGAHRRLRARLMQDLAAGVPMYCPYCHKQLSAGEPLDLAHSTGERKKLGLPGEQLACRKCNRGAVSKERAQQARKMRAETDAALRGEVMFKPGCGAFHYASAPLPVAGPGEPSCPNCGGKITGRLWDGSDLVLTVDDWSPV